MNRLFVAVVVVSVVGCSKDAPTATNPVVKSVAVAAGNAPTGANPVVKPVAIAAGNDRTPTVETRSDIMIDDYTANIVKGDLKYKGKWIKLKGPVVIVGREKNLEGVEQAFIGFQQSYQYGTGGPGTTVRLEGDKIKAFFPDDSALGAISKDQIVTVIGFGIGHEGSVTFLEKCELSPKK